MTGTKEQAQELVPGPEERPQAIVPRLVPAETLTNTGDQLERNKRNKIFSIETSGELGGIRGADTRLNAQERIRARARGLSLGPSEAEVEAALVAHTRAAGGLCWKFASPGTQGVPDRVVVLPGGKVGFVEVKRPGALPRPIQVRRLQQLAELGVPVFVLDHVDGIEEVLGAIRAS